MIVLQVHSLGSHVYIHLLFPITVLSIYYLYHINDNSLTVMINSAQSPVDTEYLVGDIEAKMFDERGGVFHSYKHGVTVLVPAKAIPSGTLAELKFAAALVAPVNFTDAATPVSALFWICMDIILEKCIEIRLPQKFVENNVSTLHFAKSLHSPTRVIDHRINVLNDGRFTASECYASIEVDHFCYYCIVDDKLDSSNIPKNRYVLIAVKQRNLSTKDNSWSVHICVVPLIKTCLEVSSLLYRLM